MFYSLTSELIFFEHPLHLKKKTFIHLTVRLQMSPAKLMLCFAHTYKIRVLKDSNPLPAKELY